MVFVEFGRKLSVYMVQPGFAITADRFSPQNKGQNQTDYHDVGDNI